MYDSCVSLKLGKPLFVFGSIEQFGKGFKIHMKLLLHSCCGPCSLEPVRLLEEEGHDLSIAYVNSNIHPQEEYEKRLSTLKEWAQLKNITVIEGAYQPQTWEDTAGLVTGFPEHAPAERCRLCYRFRFAEVANYAANHNFEAISSTLSVSPYQHTDIIREELESAAEMRGLSALFRDFRPHYREATKKSRELGMYRQNYCGCRYSIGEAEAERKARKEARKNARKHKQ